MAEEMDNPLDDELLKELGLEPKEKPAPSRAPKPAKGAQAPQAPKEPPPGAAAKRPAPPPRAPEPPKKVPPAAPQAKAPSPPVQSPEKFQEDLKSLSEDMPVQVVAVLGKRTMSLKDIISLKQGEIIELKKMPQETIDLVANGKLVARGELVLVEGKVGIQIKQLVG